MRTHRQMAIGVCLLLVWPGVAAAQKAELPWFRDATKEYGPIGGGPPAFAESGT